MSIKGNELKLKLKILLKYFILLCALKKCTKIAPMVQNRRSNNLRQQKMYWISGNCAVDLINP